MSDALGQSVGFGLALASIASVREILGTRAWFGIQVLPDAFPAWGTMGIPAGAFISLGLLLGLANWIGAIRAKKRATPLQG
jgi:electron transport complex protein RnfE